LLFPPRSDVSKPSSAIPDQRIFRDTYMLPGDGPEFLSNNCTVPASPSLRGLPRMNFYTTTGKPMDRGEIHIRGRARLLASVTSHDYLTLLLERLSQILSQSPFNEKGLKTPQGGAAGRSSSTLAPCSHGSTFCSDSRVPSIH